VAGRRRALAALDLDPALTARPRSTTTCYGAMSHEAILRHLLGLEPSGWMMAPSERLAILGLLLALKPRTALEFGCAEAGLTLWLSRCCEEVVTVDVDPSVVERTRPLANVTALCMTSEEAGRRLIAEGRRFELTVIDADHAEEPVRRDLENALRFSDVVLLHDTYHPPCRRGILAALATADVYADLDLVPGGLQPDGLWGGIGIVVPGLPRSTRSHLTPRASMYEWMRRLWTATTYRDLWRARSAAAGDRLRGLLRL
jgi:hypothetical protein